MNNAQTQIITPDQRLRVFVSSTLQELAEERQTVKNAIQNIHLIPVMFEMGARPYPPRDLYREYLAQSQIFVGIYWDRYGWIAPEETISGLEDEYNLSGNMPKLIYIKNSDGNREPRLSELLEKIQQDDKVSYKTFTDAQELGYLIINDLAVLLTERFNLTTDHQANTDRILNTLPAAPNALIGRDICLQHITETLGSLDTRLVTLSGPGGIGKTRLAIEGARLAQKQFPDGVAFVPLAPVREPSLVAETICSNLGIKISSGNTLESVKLFLENKRFLLVLDNFEQIMDAAFIVEDLLASLPDLKIIVTSRERLSLSYEHVIAVPALKDQVALEEPEVEGMLPPAIDLFVRRARALQPAFELNEANKETIFQICHRLEGLPLAIELAAGQINLLSPQLLLQKLDHRLDVLKGSFRDIPDRQKTIRNTIEWSFELLTETEQELLLRMSMFHAGCLLHTVEAIGADLGKEVLELVESLLNKSLVTKEDEGMYVRFKMLESVRDFAIENLKKSGKYDALKLMQAEYYRISLQEMKLQMNKMDQAVLLALLEKEHANIRSVMEFLLQHNELQKLTEISWHLWLFWWVNAHTKEGYNWLKKAWEQYHLQNMKFDDKSYSMLICNAGTMAFLQRDFETYRITLQQNISLVQEQDDDELVATAMLICGVVSTILRQYETAETYLQISLARYKRVNLSTGISLALSGLGRNSIYVGGKLEEAKAYYKESIALARQDHNEISEIICLSGFALCEVMQKNSDAKKYLRQSFALSQNLHFYEALAWSIEIWALVSINENRLEHAITLLAAVEHLRNLTHLPVWDDLQAIITEALAAIRQTMDAASFQKAWNEGSKMNIDTMVTFALQNEINISMAA